MSIDRDTETEGQPRYDLQQEEHTEPNLSQHGAEGEEEESVHVRETMINPLRETNWDLLSCFQQEKKSRFIKINKFSSKVFFPPDEVFPPT